MKKRSKANSKKSKKAVSVELNLKITPLSNKLLKELKATKEFKNHNQLIESAISFFYIWKKLPDEFRKLNEQKNNETGLHSQLEHVEKITSEVLLRLPMRDRK